MSTRFHLHRADLRKAFTGIINRRDRETVEERTHPSELFEVFLGVLRSCEASRRARQSRDRSNRTRTRTEADRG